MIGIPRDLTSRIRSRTRRPSLTPSAAVGLVKDHDIGSERGGAGHGNALSLTARKCFDLLADVLDRHQTKLREFLARNLTHLPFVKLTKYLAHQAGLPNFPPHEHVVGNRKRRRHRQCLVDRLDPVFPRMDWRVERDDLSVEPDLSVIRTECTRQSLDECRFAGHRCRQ